MALQNESVLLQLDNANAGEPGLFYTADKSTTYNLDKASAGEPELTNPQTIAFSSIASTSG